MAFGLLATARIGQAQHHRSAEPTGGPTGQQGARHAGLPVDAAQQALAAGDLAESYQILGQAYRIGPQAGLLFWLGRIARQRNIRSRRRTICAGP